MWPKVEKVKVVYVIAIALISVILVCGCVQFQTNTSTGPETIAGDERRSFIYKYRLCTS